MRFIRRSILLGMALLGAGLAKAAQPPANNYDVMVFTRPVPGTDAEFNAWYDQQHVPDLLRVPGFMAARRWKLQIGATPTSTLPPYLVIYEVQTGNLAATDAEVAKRAANGTIRHGAALDYPAIETVIMAPIGPKIFAKDLPGTRPALAVPGNTSLMDYSLVVFTRPMPGREAEYNAFYNEKHMPDVIRVPGFISGRRFHMVSNESHNRDIPPYLVIYDFKSYDLSATIAEILRRAKTGVTRMSSSFSPDAMVYYFAPLGPRVLAAP